LYIVASKDGRTFEQDIVVGVCYGPVDVERASALDSKVEPNLRGFLVSTVQRHLPSQDTPNRQFQKQKEKQQEVGDFALHPKYALFF
jgi:hypothetical protein